MTRPGLKPSTTRSIRVEADAHAERAVATLDSPEEKRAAGWLVQSAAEKAHWTGYLSAYRRHLDAHPELADQPLGTKCSHRPPCTIGLPLTAAPGAPDRDVGADDDSDSPAYRPDPRLPPEREPELPFTT